MGDYCIRLIYFDSRTLTEINRYRIHHHHHLRCHRGLDQAGRIREASRRNLTNLLAPCTFSFSFSFLQFPFVLTIYHVQLSTLLFSKLELNFKLGEVQVQVQIRL